MAGGFITTYMTLLKDYLDIATGLSGFSLNVYLIIFVLFLLTGARRNLLRAKHGQ
ncbi:hypothetical protein [Klebsiella quasipneumoniae]|uniref:hypothetical protein n=1 Tax=Klebsiella quasipneumoniae TaxID=1463165 RepID=UPI000ABA02AB|nr:hypothetical protein [Klebsiella quasipneumoniae]